MDFRQHAFEVFDFQILNLQLNTPLFILALILVVMLCVNLLLFRPVLRTLDGRRGELDRLAKETAAQKADIAALMERYKRDLDRVRGEVETVRQQSHAASQKAQERVLEQARQDADRELQSALAVLRDEVAQARAQRERTVQQLASQTADRMLSA
ncbi:MAG: ATP synthase F0 subunit B [SAR324 cluster bacterium]